MDSALSYLKMAILKKEAKFLKHCRSQGHWRSNRANRDKSMNLVQIFSSRGTAVRGPRGQGVPLGAPHMLICPGSVVSPLPPWGKVALALSGLWGWRGGCLRAVSKVGSSVSAPPCLPTFRHSLWLPFVTIYDCFSIAILWLLLQSWSS